ncbi:MAG: hypothetical protein KAR39_12385 [Thermoplasmata archaeon]|nr:hypothetical protein [Thermoplasmata archaeon]
MPERHPYNTNIFSLRNIALVEPGGGSEVTYLVPAGMRIQVISFSAVFNAAAAAGNRIAAVCIDDVPTIQMYSPMLNHIIINEIVQLYWSTVSGRTDHHPAEAIMTAPMSRDMFLEPGSTFSTATLNMDAGDFYSTPTLRAKVWLDL